MSWLHIPSVEWWIVAALATFRLASIIHSERIARPVRAIFGIVEQEQGGETLISYPDTFFGHLLECFWCVSVWASFGVTVILITPLYPVLLPFALSAVAIGYRKWVD